MLLFRRRSRLGGHNVYDLRTCKAVLHSLKPNFIAVQLFIYHSGTAGQVQKSSRISTSPRPSGGRLRLHRSVHSAPQGSSLCSTSWTGQSHWEVRFRLPSSPVWQRPRRETCPESGCRSRPEGGAGRGRGTSCSDPFHWCKHAASGLDETRWCRWSTTGVVLTLFPHALSFPTATHLNWSLCLEVPAQCFSFLALCRQTPSMVSCGSDEQVHRRSAHQGHGLQCQPSTSRNKDDRPTLSSCLAGWRQQNHLAWKV